MKNSLRLIATALAFATGSAAFAQEHGSKPQKERRPREERSLKINDDGSISLPDGTVIQPNEDGTYTLPNGEVIKPSKRSPDGDPGRNGGRNSPPGDPGRNGGSKPSGGDRGREGGGRPPGGEPGREGSGPPTGGR